MGSFYGVDVGGSINVSVIQDSACSARIEADANLLQYIQTINDNGVLHIHTEEGYNLNPSRKIIVYVAAPQWKSFEASGACNVYGENQISSPDMIDVNASGSCDVNLNLNSPKIVADLSGACDISLKGQTKEFRVEGSGSTGIKSMDLMAENVDVDISGSGDAAVFASVKLDVHVSGSGSVQYKGTPQVNQSISGSGSVRKVE